MTELWLLFYESNQQINFNDNQFKGQTFFKFRGIILLWSATAIIFIRNEHIVGFVGSEELCSSVQIWNSHTLTA